jgi:chemotaxis protein CheX
MEGVLMMAAMSLAPVLDFAAAVPLRDDLLAQRGQDLELDAAAVSRVGGQCLQVLLAAQRSWTADGRAFRLINVSDACRDALAITQARALLGAEE